MLGKCIIVMGVSGSGKSTIGEVLSSEIKAKFIDGDDLHPKSNVLKMARGEALNDEDRQPWLERVRDAAFSIEQKNETCVIVCSALKKRYRDQLRDGNKNLLFIYLEGALQTILTRIKQREGHYMKSNLVNSQFEALESPVGEPDVIVIDVEKDINSIVTQAVRDLENFKIKSLENL